jgi:hypothetical protein
MLHRLITIPLLSFSYRICIPLAQWEFNVSDNVRESCSFGLYVYKRLLFYIFNKSRAVAISYTHRPHALDELVRILSLLVPTL